MKASGRARSKEIDGYVPGARGPGGLEPGELFRREARFVCPG
ncbi:hypothetical protein NH8B_3598 [Pseudogulbenkiania sp. NH8B]|nr:hypothetical protein NH8B_3598 [Pseudogulbenkiania sp. NH8B]